MVTAMTVGEDEFSRDVPQTPATFLVFRYFHIKKVRSPCLKHRLVNLSTAHISFRIAPIPPSKPHTRKPEFPCIASQTFSYHTGTRISLGFFSRRRSMAEHSVVESLMDKITEKIHGHDSSSSDSDDDKPSKVDAVKSKIFRLFGREKPIHKVLGGGKPADVLLWRNNRISASILGAATTVWVLFELLEYHLITLICHISILSLAILFLWSNASTFINKSPPEIPEIVIPEKRVLEVASALRLETNRALAVLHVIASGKDVKKFLTVIAGLWVLSIVGSWFNFLTLIYIAFVLLHSLPVFYEKYEDHVDSFSEKAWIEIKKQYAELDAKYLSKIPKGPLKEKKKD